MLGCTTSITTLTEGYEVGDLLLESRLLTQHSLFGWLPTVLKEERLARCGSTWFLTYPGGGSPLEEFSDEYAVEIDHTFTLLVYLKGDFLPERVYKTIVELLGKGKRDVYLIKSKAFTLNQTPIIHTIYHLCELPTGSFSYVSFEDIDDMSVQVYLYDEPIDESDTSVF